MTAPWVRNVCHAVGVLATALPLVVPNIEHTSWTGSLGHTIGAATRGCFNLSRPSFPSEYLLCARPVDFAVVLPHSMLSSTYSLKRVTKQHCASTDLMQMILWHHNVHALMPVIVAGSPFTNSVRPEYIRMRTTNRRSIPFNVYGWATYHMVRITAGCQGVSNHGLSEHSAHGQASLQSYLVVYKIWSTCISVNFAGRLQRLI